MRTNWGSVPVNSVIPFVFDTYGGTDGESITLSNLLVSDIEVYKGTSMTQRTSDAGYALLDTDGIDIDGRTGIHGFSIDTSDNTDSGFYAADSFYTVIVDAVTVDTQTVRFTAGTFRLETVVTVQDVIDGVLDELLSGHSVSGSVGQALTDILLDTGTTLQGELDGIQADTEDIQARLPAALTGAGNMKSDLLAISGDATAADTLESYLDGSEFMPVDAHQQEWTVTGGTLQPKKPDGTTNTSYSRTVGTDPTAEPIVSST